MTTQHQAREIICRTSSPGKTGSEAHDTLLRRSQRSARQSVEGGGGARSVAVLYGSQTGTAQEIARNIHAAAQEKGFKAQVSRGLRANGVCCTPG